MSNPNKTVERARQSKVIREETFTSKTVAATTASEWQDEGLRVRITSVKVGPKPSTANGYQQNYMYTVRAYAS